MQATKQQQLKCSWPGCLHKYSSNKGLKYHKILHMDRDYIKQHVCDWPGCGYKTIHGSNLSKHKYVKHPGTNKPRNFKCSWPACHFSYVTQSCLSRHKTLHYSDERYY